MQLSSLQREHYATQGSLLLPEALDSACLSGLTSELPEVLRRAGDGCVLEQDGRTVRSVYCTQLKSGLLAQLARDSRLLCPAQQLLGGDVYLYQMKVNFKRAHTGGAWSWHQDFVYWHNEDGLPTASLINAVVFLDEVTPENGPIQLLSKSHVGGLLPAQPVTPERRERVPTQREVVTGDRYTLTGAQVTRLRRQGKQFAATGKRGSVLYFHPNLVHSSSSNRSGHDRKLLLMTYCDVRNRPSLRRPDYLVGRDYSPLQPLPLV